jgi:hypothetical protein
MTAKEYQAQHGRGATTAPAQAPTKTAPKLSPTNELTKAVIQLLQLRGFFVWRQNNGGVWDPTRQVFRANSSTPGISDVLGYHLATGRIAAVEVKAGKDKLRPDQISFLAGIRAAGGFACCGRDVAQVEAELKDYLTALSIPV